ncbi:response regulator [Nocardioides perillae]|uniref:DNA-binding response OmpR family regulator n=1 Tax=Nocardioides perillae TaxID=1119534 RepID=A0A7Y9RVS8_9ACTN|nr:DNA-binding response OmpR family regulator [Nocardioides perillae]
MPQHTAVVVEDDPDIAELLQIALEAVGVTSERATTGAEAVELVRRLDPDLVTLDLTLPDMDGTEVCRRLRGFTDCYVVMITGRTEEVDRLVGLEIGADDYLAKPFSPRELGARAAALLRRPRAGVAPAGPAATAAPPAPVAEPVEAGGFRYDPVTGTGVLGGTAVALTPGEADLLATLAARPGHAWSRADLVREVYDGEFIESDYLIDVQVAGLRRKLRRAGAGTGWISTVEGSLYAFTPPTAG